MKNSFQLASFLIQSVAYQSNVDSYYLNSVNELLVLFYEPFIHIQYNVNYY